jgi:hypothetical protein
MAGDSVVALRPLDEVLSGLPPGDDYAPPGEAAAPGALAPAEPEGPWRSRFGGGFIKDILSAAPVERQWVVKNALAAKAFHLVLGAPGCGKSFLVTDLGMTLALAAADPKAAQEWFSMKIKPCGVIYVAAEGQDDFVFRLRAWLNRMSIALDKPIPFYLIPSAIDMRSDAAIVETLAQEIAHVSQQCRDEFGFPVNLVVIDTVNRALAGGDDAKAEAVGPFIRNCTTIRERCDVAVLGVHHLPKAEGATDPRGHSSLKGDNDGQWLVAGARNGRPNSWAITRLKAGPTGARFEFRLRQEKLGQDSEGDEITSCTVMALGSDPSIEGAEARDIGETTTRRPQFTSDGRAILGDNLTMSLRALAKAIEEAGQFPPLGTRAPHGRRAVTTKAWFEEIVRIMPGDDKAEEKFRDRCRKARDAAAMRLTLRNIIGMDGEWVWRTDRRVFSVDDAAPSETRPENSGEAGKNSGEDIF